jgi:thiol-disulfide isomerase/thioredoxin
MLFLTSIARIIASGFILLLFSIVSNAQGIQFEHGTWSEALAKSKAEGKPIFLDAMTSWCGPCKMMAKEVFPDPEVGAFFNANFVNIKLDMERGAGIEVSSIYRIWVYPTLVFVDTAGTVLHRSAGYQNAQELLALGKLALDPTNNLASLEKQYASGNRQKAFMLKYLKAKTQAYDPDASRLANDFLKTESELGTPENMKLLMQHAEDPYSTGFQFLLKNRLLFEEKFDKREVKVKIETVFEGYLQSHPGMELEAVQQLYKTAYPEGGEAMASRYRIDYYHQKNDPENFAQTAIDHFKRYPSDDPDELDAMASVFAEEVNDPVQLQTALGWSQKAIAIQETFYYQYTLAKLWAKIGKEKAAKKAAQRSIELAKADGEDTTLMEEFLEELKR